MPKSEKCGLCGKTSKTHRKANHGKGKKGRSALKPLIKTKADLLRKADQEDELGCLAALDGDREDAKQHFDNAKQLKQEAKWTA